MLKNYWPILVFIIMGLGFGMVPLALGWLIGPRRANAAKEAPYECGFEPFEDARIQFDVRFYLVAILFILFDVETAFFFPWAVALRHIGWAGFAAMMCFLFILCIGFLYEWRKGALEWE